MCFNFNLSTFNACYNHNIDCNITHPTTTNLHSSGVSVSVVSDTSKNRTSLNPDVHGDGKEVEVVKETKENESGDTPTSRGLTRLSIEQVTVKTKIQIEKRYDSTLSGKR